MATSMFLTIEYLCPDSGEWRHFDELYGTERDVREYVESEGTTRWAREWRVERFRATVQPQPLVYFSRKG